MDPDYPERPRVGASPWVGGCQFRRGVLTTLGDAPGISNQGVMDACCDCPRRCPVVHF